MLARRLYEQALAVDPKDADARSHLGQLLLDIGQPAHAEAGMGVRRWALGVRVWRLGFGGWGLV
jgi:hypothetical protein